MEEWEDEFTMYRITPAPPRESDLQRYIDRYLAEKDKKYFGWFLHYYERIINEKAMGIVQDYAMAGHFSDVKQAYAMGMWAALQTYDPNRGVPFIVYKEYAAMRAVHDHIRTMRNGHTVPTDDEYRRLRRAMRLYWEYGEKSDPATMEKIAAELATSMEKTLEIIEAGLRSTRFVEFYRTYADVDSEEGQSHTTVHPKRKRCSSGLNGQMQSWRRLRASTTGNGQSFQRTSDSVWSVIPRKIKESRSSTLPLTTPYPPPIQRTRFTAEPCGK